MDKAKLGQPETKVVTLSPSKGENVIEVKPVKEAVLATAAISEDAQAQISCSLDDPDSCEMCSG